MTYIAGSQFPGLLILKPCFNKLHICCVSRPWYGVPPKVAISHNKIPKDQLQIQSSEKCDRLFTTQYSDKQYKNMYKFNI